MLLNIGIALMIIELVFQNLEAKTTFLYISIGCSLVSLLPSIYRLFLKYRNRKNKQLIMPIYFSRSDKNKLITLCFIVCSYFLFAEILGSIPESFKGLYLFACIICLVMIIPKIKDGSTNLGHIELSEHSIFICDKIYNHGAELNFPDDSNSIEVHKNGLRIKQATAFHKGNFLLTPILGKKQDYDISFDTIRESDLSMLKEFLHQEGLTNNASLSFNLFLT